MILRCHALRRCLKAGAVALIVALLAATLAWFMLS